MVKKIWIIIGISAVSFSLYAQPYPEIGKPMPDFTLTNIEYYPKKQATLKDFKGKWLLLDFWNEACGACVASFPRSNEMQKKFRDKLQIMLIGIPKPNNIIRKLYATYREHEDLVLPCAFDGMLNRKFQINDALPYIILVDDKGIVRTITSRVHSEDMEAFFAGQDPKLDRVYRRNEEAPKDKKFPFDIRKPFLIAGNGGYDTSFLFRSILSIWNPTSQQQYLSGGVTDDDAKNGSFQVMAAPLEMLYSYAYFGLGWLPGGDARDTLNYGKVYPHLVLEIKDSSAFRYSYKNGIAKNWFNYSLIIPPNKDGTTESLRKAMQRDLQNYFGFEARIETRDCPCWKLVALPDAEVKLKSQGGVRSITGTPRSGFEAKNYAFKEISKAIIYNLDGVFLFDETGININVDIKLEYVQNHLDDLNKALQVYGLDLVETTRPMKVLVIRDKDN